MKIFCLTTSLLLTSFFLFAKPVKIRVTNKLRVERKEELVVFSRELLDKKLGRITPGKFVIIKHNNLPQVIQFDDLDKDGDWDEVVFLYHFKPKEKVVFTVEVSDLPYNTKPGVQAHVRHRHKLADESFGPSVPQEIADGPVRAILQVKIL